MIGKIVKKKQNKPFKDEVNMKDNELFGTVSNPVETKSYTVGLKDGKVIDNSVDAAEFMQIGKTVAVCFNTENYENEVELKLGDYEIVVRDGKTYAILKKPKYPKTYEECYRIMKIHSSYKLELCGKSTTQGEITNCVYTQNLLKKINKFHTLLICRDAYWKIAGEEMGLGKPWEPNDLYSDYITGRYCIFVHQGNIICSTPVEDCPLTFPTEEIRDAFYENFKDLIEQCKELL